MNSAWQNLIGPAVSVLLFILPASAADTPPTEWIEPATGHRVIRLSSEPGSASLYFHQNAYTTEGDKLVIVTPEGLSTVHLQTRALELVVPRARYAMGGSSGIEVGRKTRQVYYTRRVENQTVIFATHLDTRATREIAKLPFSATFGGVNADETFLVGASNESRTGSPGDSARPRPASSETNAQLPATAPSPARRPDAFGRNPGPRAMRLFAVSTKTGEVQTFHPSTNWLNHVQCSPTDPTLVLFCHEGEWHNLDRVWTIRLGSDDARLMHRRTVPYEIAGHEFFSADGQWVWYDLQTPRSKEFWLAGVHVGTGARIRYPIARSQWSVHYNVARDGARFAGDGGGPDSVANRTALPERRPLDPPGNGQWIYLFTPRPGEFEPLKVGNETVKIGQLEVEKLVDLSRHNYRLEPNVTFTPDGRWIVFRSNMHGSTHVYAVEVAKSR
jgi:oligogalacturonide lyase